MDQTEAELESFRQKWREEVSARRQSRTAGSAATPKPSHTSSSRSQVPRSTPPEIPTDKLRDRAEELDEVEPPGYHDLGEIESGRRLGDIGSSSAISTNEPRSALEHYEQAVEKESQGSLGDSVNLYRKAFRLDSGVHETYKKKHFPASSFQRPKPKQQDVNPSNAPVTVPNTAHHSLYGLPAALSNLLQDFSSLSIVGEAPPTDFSPAQPCPIATLPEELLVEILLQLAIHDVASFARLAQVCKRLAFLVATEERVWKRVALGPEVGFEAMHYEWACKVNGKPLGDDGEGELLLSSESENPPSVPSPLTTLLVPAIYPSYRALFRQRPRIRFNGCYISTVNYTRPGASSPTSISWNSPIHIVTYYRYLRFLRNGTCISLLTTAEPGDVIPHMLPENVHKNHSGGLPSAVMKDALRGRWRLSGPVQPILPLENQEGNALVPKAEEEGTVHVETEGVTPKYLYKMALSLGSAGRGVRNNKLVWKGYWSYNRLTDDWAEFGLKNDRAFYWSRVKSYGMGL
ncbi:hypothetical protein K432DRAFT_431155 [Lepidopterella palustris CBS 459.81]|uniref:F-box domain-containing protein n=1 Tax=Lepidopterella palustris CBS 459.81 TaxID=1314670 RepID=A0A8E2ELV1_9PEZI|nr:hypothetical protein K432DRAFT_431155 [Lepidopterella palustris CBS 459.81]